MLLFRYSKLYKGDNGKHGSGNNKTGRTGVNTYIQFPLGTEIYDITEGKHEKIAEITQNGQEVILAKGGLGGKGNSRFATSTNQAPRKSYPGRKGGYLELELVLKLMADVGLVGFPNAGKSTLLSVLTAAKPKIADYAFTTLKPNLGIVEYRDFKSFVIADIPGIIEGAAEGKGLGHRFLRHIERNSILLFLIPADSDDIQKEYAILLNELKQHNPELLDKDRLLAISKSDMLDDELIIEIQKELPKDISSMFISSIAQTGLSELKDKLWQLLNN